MTERNGPVTATAAEVELQLEEKIPLLSGRRKLVLQLFIRQITGPPTLKFFI